MNDFIATIMAIHGLMSNLGIEGVKLLPVHIGFRLLYRRFDSDVCAIDDTNNSWKSGKCL